jgi:hypothetical protein
VALDHRRELLAKQRQILGEQVDLLLGAVVEIEAQPREPTLERERRGHLVGDRRRVGHAMHSARAVR